MCCFVLLYRYWGIVTVPGSIPYGSRPGVAGSSPFTLTTSLAIPVPSSSSSNGPTNYSVDNHGLEPWQLRRLGRSKVRSASLVRVLSDETGPSGTESQSLSNRVCVALFLLKRYWGIVTVPGSIPFGSDLGGWILTLHLDYVAGYTGPLLFLFKRTQQLLR